MYSHVPPQQTIDEKKILIILEDRPLRFEASNFEVEKIVLPIEDKRLYILGQQVGLPMSDIFSFMTLRAVTHYQGLNTDKTLTTIRPIITPLSLRKSALATDEGNNRAIKQFPVVFPMESIE